MQTKMQAESRLLNWGSAAALLLLFAVSLSVGVADFSWRNLFAMPDEWQLLLTSRLPRTFAIVLTGASMAVAGMILQILMKNRFIEPSMVGATQSASLGLLLMALLFPAATLMVKMSVAAAAALAGMLVFMLLIRRLPPTAQLMVPLVGIIFGSIIESAAVFVAYETETLQLLSVWHLGDFSGVLLGRYELLWLAGLLALAAYLIADRLTILGLGETVSINLGLNRQTILWAGLVIVALITSLVVVTVGSIPFIGLVVPNIVSRLVGDKLRQSLPSVALLGAVSPERLEHLAGDTEFLRQLDERRRDEVAQADPDDRAELDLAGVKGHPGLGDRAEDPTGTLAVLHLGGEVVEADDHVLGGHGHRTTVGRLEDVVARQHEDAGLGLSLGRERQVHGHLVTVEVSVERSTNERV